MSGRVNRMGTFVNTWAGWSINEHQILSVSAARLPDPSRCWVRIRRAILAAATLSCNAVWHSGSRSEVDIMTDAAEDLRRELRGARFGTVLADPPWRFMNRTGKVAPEHR